MSQQSAGDLLALQQEDVGAMATTEDRTKSENRKVTGVQISSAVQNIPTSTTAEQHLGQEQGQFQGQGENIYLEDNAIVGSQYAGQEGGDSATVPYNNAIPNVMNYPQQYYSPNFQASAVQAATEMPQTHTDASSQKLKQQYIYYPIVQQQHLLQQQQLQDLPISQQLPYLQQSPPSNDTLGDIKRMPGNPYPTVHTYMTNMLQSELVAPQHRQLQYFSYQATTQSGNEPNESQHAQTYLPALSQLPPPEPPSQDFSIKALENPGQQLLTESYFTPIERKASQENEASQQQHNPLHLLVSTTPLESTMKDVVDQAYAKKDVNSVEINDEYCSKMKPKAGDELRAESGKDSLGGDSAAELDTDLDADSTAFDDDHYEDDDVDDNDNDGNEETAKVPSNRSSRKKRVERTNEFWYNLVVKKVHNEDPDVRNWTAAKFLKSDVSGPDVSGTASEQQQFNRRLRLFERGELPGAPDKDGRLSLDSVKQRNRKGKYFELECKLMRFLELKTELYKQERCGLSWVDIQVKAQEYVDLEKRRAMNGSEEDAKAAEKYKDFKVSPGWVMNFLKRNGIYRCIRKEVQAELYALDLEPFNPPPEPEEKELSSTNDVVDSKLTQPLEITTMSQAFEALNKVRQFCSDYCQDTFKADDFELFNVCEAKLKGSSGKRRRGSRGMVKRRKLDGEEKSSLSLSYHSADDGPCTINDDDDKKSKRDEPNPAVTQTRKVLDL